MIAGLLAVGFAGAHAQQKELEPVEGQPGKDIVFQTTPDAVVHRMLQMAHTTKADYVIDLGAGDGRIVIAAARDFGARSLGVEYDSNLVALARTKARMAGVSDRTQFVQGDLFAYDFSAATVLTLYLEEALNVRLRERVLALRPGTRVVSHAFRMGDWAPDERATEDDRELFLWIVPERVAGTWDFAFRRAEVQKLHAQLMQRFQEISADRRHQEIPGDLDGRMRGRDIAFNYRDVRGGLLRCAGRVDRERMEGRCRIAGAADFTWSALRRP